MISKSLPVAPFSSVSLAEQGKLMKIDIFFRQTKIETSADLYFSSEASEINEYPDMKQGKHLKVLGHEIRFQFKLYGLIDLGLEKVRQIFIIF
jgi:hypothetical protein